MIQKTANNPDLNRLRGVVAAEILDAILLASRTLREAGILAGGLAVGRTVIRARDKSYYFSGRR